jgi:hypothetical protein
MRLLLLLALGCQGAVGDPGQTIDEVTLPPPDDPPPPADPCSPEAKVAIRPMSRLTVARYAQSVSDVFAVDPVIASSLVDDDDLQGFEYGNAMSELHAERYLETAHRIAVEVTRRIDRVVTCDPGTTPASERSCAIETLERLARLAYRRSLDEGSRADLAATYDLGRDGATFAAGVELAIEAILASPDFIYHVEHGTAGEPNDVVPLDDAALAGRLSFFLWNRGPDAALLDRAEAGSIRTPDEIEAVAREMLADARSDAGVLAFFRQWLSLDWLANSEKSYQVYEPFHGRVVLATRDSIDRFLLEVFRSDATFDSLLTRPSFWINDEMAAIYDYPAPGSTELVRVDADPAEFAGILTHPALLAILARPNQSNPIQRGRFIRERVLCQELPAPPVSVDTSVEEPMAGLSTRDRFAAHTEDPSCAACHVLLDPVGFGFENYDGIGRFRTIDDGVPVDARGELTEAGDAEGPFVGAVELAHKLAGSSLAQQCFSRQWFRFAVGRRETEADECTIDEINGRFVESGLDMRELLVAIARTDAFRMTRIEEAP